MDNYEKGKCMNICISIAENGYTVCASLHRGTGEIYNTESKNYIAKDEKEVVALVSKLLEGEKKESSMLS